MQVLNTLLSYVGAHWMLILSVVLATVALSAIAWFAKNWKAAVAAVVLVVAGLAYQSADLAGYKRAVDEAKAVEIDTLQKRLDVLAAITKAYNDRYASDTAKITQLEEQASATPKNDGVCLDADAARRVRDIRGTPDTGATPVPSRRTPNVFPWRHRRP